MGPTVTTSCLDDATLSAFLDGRLDGAARAGVESHLAECPECYRLFADTARFLADERENDARRSRRAGARLVRVALPLAAGLAIALLWIGRGPGGPPGSPPPGQAALQVLVESVDAAVLKQSGPVALGAARGFAPEPGARDVLVGVRLADLELARLFGSEEQERELARDLAERLRVPLPDGDAARKLRRAALAQGGRAEHLQLGEWLEAARLAASAREAKFFADARTRRALSSPPGGLPEAVARELRRVVSLLQPVPATDADWRELERALTDAILLL